MAGMAGAVGVAGVAGGGAVGTAARSGPSRSGRRRWLRRLASLTAGGGGSVALPWLAGCAAPPAGGDGGGPAERASPGLRFKPVVIARDDNVHVPEGYAATVLLPWGDPVGLSRGLPPFRPDASNGADEQALQAGMDHDGMQFFPSPWRPCQGVAALADPQASSERGFLAINHAYADATLLFADGAAQWSLAKARKSQRAVGVSIVDVLRVGPRWTLQRPSPHAQRIHAETPLRIAGPAAGHDAMKTARSATGRAGLGTLANGGGGWTPWGTYLSCERNFELAFKGRARPSADEARYGIGAAANLMRWGDVDPRFDVERNPNEPNHFGWIVEIDPHDPSVPPVKRTALGRFKHEAATPAIAPDGRVAFYLTDEQAFEYLYKFVTARPWQPADRAANRDLLDEGTLYVARFQDDGSGRWIELVQGRNGLTAGAGFASQADVLIRTRQAADRVGATRLDRPRGTAVDPRSGTVYCALAGNAERGAPGRPGIDAVNPDGPNPFGRLLAVDERDGGPAGAAFAWRLLSPGGDPLPDPDGLAFDAGGLLWVQTGIRPADLLQRAFASFGNNQMLVFDPASGEARRFMTGPRGSELGGACFTPDGTTLFVNVRHPGETGSNGADPNPSRRLSSWPDSRAGGRPRSATLAIRRIEGGVIGS
ncbi:MAG: PhoX family phosphatase [Burkholderiaceae bacterium]